MSACCVRFYIKKKIGEKSKVYCSQCHKQIIDYEWSKVKNKIDFVKMGCNMHKEFEMTDEQLATLLEACKPVPMIALQYGPVPSQQENTNNNKHMY